MLKVLFHSVLGLGLCVSIVGLGYAGPVQKSPIQAPPPGPAAPPAPMAAAPGGGYRTYSYEPGVEYGRSYSRAGGFRQPSFLDARHKALGR